MTEKKRYRVLSGIQPSGNLTIGNYIGAIRQWVAHQHEFDAFYCVVDLHAITVPYTPSELSAKSREVAALYVACGLDTSATIFIQSHVRAHSELAWLLGCVTPLGWLYRMTQFKDKSAKEQSDSVLSGLLNYPVLMAADILLYQAELVPVGDDQKQHIELTRDIAQRFNHLFGDTFVLPDPFIPPEGARIMGLDDPIAKMSKSTHAQGHAVYLLDSPDKAQKKIMRAVTDSGSEIRFSDDPLKAGVNNLLTIYHSITGESKEHIEAHFDGQGYGMLKKTVAEAVVETLKPIQARYHELTSASGFIDHLLAQGAERANAVAEVTLKKVRQSMGFLPIPS